MIDAQAEIFGTQAQRLCAALDSFDERAMIVAASVRTFQPVEVDMLEAMERDLLRILDIISPAIRLAIARHAHAEASA